MAALNTMVDGPDNVLAPDATQPVALVHWFCMSS
jgi:hypothetical protein